MEFCASALRNGMLPPLVGLQGNSHLAAIYQS
jgi:hypothetical protein